MVRENDAEKYQRENWLARKLISNFQKKLAEILLSIDYQTLHEVGCGEGFSSQFFNSVEKANYSGSDVSNQALRLAEAYPEPILIVEGDFQEALSTVENPRALWGALASLSLRFHGKFHLFYTGEETQTAELIYVLARQVSARPRHVGPVVKHRRKLGSLGEAQLAVVCSLPGVGPRLAERLLKTPSASSSES